MTEEEFDRRLDALLERARRDGVPVRGSWVCDGADEPSDYEILITEVAPSR